MSANDATTRQRRATSKPRPGENADVGVMVGRGDPTGVATIVGVTVMLIC